MGWEVAVAAAVAATRDDGGGDFLSSAPALRRPFLAGSNATLSSCCPDQRSTSSVPAELQVDRKKEIVLLQNKQISEQMLPR